MKPAPPVELVDGVLEPEVALLDEVPEVHALGEGVTAGDRDDQPEVGADEAVLRLGAGGDDAPQLGAALAVGDALGRLATSLDGAWTAASPRPRRGGRPCRSRSGTCRWNHSLRRGPTGPDARTFPPDAPEPNRCPGLRSPADDGQATIGGAAVTDQPRAGGSAGGDVIVLEAVRKEFGAFVAVEHADFSIGRGEFFSLLGPSGCGKTTLLKMIAGFELPTSGRVLLEGVDVSTCRRTSATSTPSSSSTPCSRTCRCSTTSASACGRRRSRAARPAGARWRCSRSSASPSSPAAGRRQLSGGQQQRVALARALVNLPSALLLDEPLAALDLKLREAMQIELKRIQREVGITFIFVTHDQGEALTMSDRIAVMSRGQVEQIGTPEEIYGAPASVFVAGFIGSANLLPGRLDAVAPDGATVRLDGGALVPVAGVTAGRAGDPVTVMLRPERLNLGGQRRRHRRAATVKDVIYQGSERRLIIHLTTAPRSSRSVDAETAATNGAARGGDDVSLTWSPDAPYLLRGRSGIIGATTTDVDEVQASLDGTDVITTAPGAPPAAPPAPPPERRFGRRALIVGGAVLGTAAVIGGVLAVTGSGDTAGSDDGGDSAGGIGTGDTAVRVLNWPAYIDPTEDGATGHHRPLPRRPPGSTSPTARTSTTTTRSTTATSPRSLSQGQEVAYDIVCADELDGRPPKDLGWLDPLPVDRIPNRVNLDERFLAQSWDYGASYNLPWQAGHHRHRLQPRARRARADEHQRPLRPGVQGQGGDAHRDARHRRPDDARHGPRPVGPRRGGCAGRDRQDRAGHRRRADPGVHRQRLPAQAWRAATSWPAWRGRATSSSCRRPVPTSGS